MASERWPRPQDPYESDPRYGVARYDDDRAANGRYGDGQYAHELSGDGRYGDGQHADGQYGDRTTGFGPPRTLPAGASRGGEYRHAVIRDASDPFGRPGSPAGAGQWPARPGEEIGPRQPDPRLAYPRQADPRQADPRLADPRLADPRLADPRLVEPGPADPRFVADPRTRPDPRLMSDPRFAPDPWFGPRTHPAGSRPQADPRLADPRLGDPRHVDPRLADPRLWADRRVFDPHRPGPGLSDQYPDNRLSDPGLADPRLLDPRLADPRYRTEVRLPATRPPRAIEAPRLAIETSHRVDDAAREDPLPSAPSQPGADQRWTSDPPAIESQWNADSPQHAGQRRGHGENTRSVHLPVQPPPRQPPLATPIYRTASFTFGSSAEYASVLADATPGFSYSRIDNPTVEAFCCAVAALEGVHLNYQPAAQAFASGMAAISTVFWTFARAGARVIAPSAMYGGSYSFLRNVATNFGVQTDFVDMTDLDQVRASLRPGTAIVYAETLANPTVAVADIAGLARLAHEAGAMLIVDSTLAPPVICRPLEHGADLVLHSATKYFGGHADVTGGVVTGHPELIRKIRKVRIDTGGSLGPDDSYLLRRGLETLPLRVRRQCATALLLAAGLARHPAVRTVYYPGLTQHPGHALATRQFDAGPEGTRFGAIVTVAPYGGREAGMMFADRLRLAKLATSLGGTYTKVSHVGSTTHRQMDSAALAAAGIDPGSVRFSVGLEDGEDLLGDAIVALDSLGRR